MGDIDCEWNSMNNKGICRDMNFKVASTDFTKEENQRIVLKEFRRLVKDLLEPHHDDSFLLRWLRARDYDIIKAEKMIRESFKFRKKIGADNILNSEYQLPEVFNKYPVTAFLGSDNEHSTVRIFMAGNCDYKGFVYSLRIAEILKLVVYFLESDFKLLQEKKKKYGKLDTRTTFIFDFKNFSLKHFYDKAVINTGIQLITMYQDNYPETLKVAHLINVPTYFSWIFNIFKPFLNEVTLSKIKIYKTDEWKKALINTIDPEILPVFLGGDRTGSDGNPLCPELVSWETKINPSFYLSHNKKFGGESDPDMKSATVHQRATFQVPVAVTKNGSLLKYTFRTNEYNIRFGLFYKAENSKRTEDIIPVDSVDCHVIPEQNNLICEKKGTYILHFDNSYSWLNSKQLFYKVDLFPGTVIETNNN